MKQVLKSLKEEPAHLLGLRGGDYHQQKRAKEDLKSAAIYKIERRRGKNTKTEAERCKRLTAEGVMEKLQAEGC